jgi:hypothetical protein
MGATMGLDEGARKWVLEFREQDASLSRLPKNVRFLGEVLAEADSMSQSSTGMYEFEVVRGNAAYREGEHFYLTPAQAQRVYFSCGANFRNQRDETSRA